MKVGPRTPPGCVAEAPTDVRDEDALALDIGVPRVGVDIVLISRAAELVRPERRPVLGRMLRPEEIVACTRGGRLDPSAVAGVLAVKEAVFKLLHTRDVPVPWRSVRVESGPGRWPEIRLDGAAARLAEAAGMQSEISVSLAHDGAYAVAVAASIHTKARAEGCSRGSSAGGFADDAAGDGH